MEPVEGRKGRRPGGSIHRRKLLAGGGFALHPRRAPLRRGRPEQEAAHVGRRVHPGEWKRVLVVDIVAAETKPACLSRAAWTFRKFRQLSDTFRFRGSRTNATSEVRFLGVLLLMQTARIQEEREMNK